MSETMVAISLLTLPSLSMTQERHAPLPGDIICINPQDLSPADYTLFTISAATAYLEHRRNRRLTTSKTPRCCGIVGYRGYDPSGGSTVSKNETRRIGITVLLVLHEGIEKLTITQKKRR